MGTGSDIVNTLINEYNVDLSSAARGIISGRLQSVLDGNASVGYMSIIAALQYANPSHGFTRLDYDEMGTNHPGIFSPGTIITNADLEAYTSDNPFDAGTGSYTFELTATDALAASITNFEDNDAFVFINASESDFVVTNPTYFDEQAEITVKQVEVELVGLVGDFFWDAATFRQVFGEDSLTFESGPVASLGLNITSGHVSDPVVFEIQNWSAGSMQGHVVLEQDGVQVEQALGNNGQVLIAGHGFDPGAVFVTVEVQSGNETILDASKTIGLYDADQDYEFTWADTDIEPFNMIGQVVVQHAGQQGYATGTGFLISPMHVMTNAHVVSLQEDQEYLDDLVALEFFLGRNGQSLFQEANNNQYSGTHVFLEKDEWDGYEWPDTDMSIITLDSPIQGLDEQLHFDWFWNARGTSTDLIGQTVFGSGYPARGMNQGVDQYGSEIAFQWAVEGEVTGYWDGFDEYGGASGGLQFSDSFGSTGQFGTG